MRVFFMPCFISEIVKMNMFCGGCNLMQHLVPCHRRTWPIITSKQFISKLSTSFQQVCSFSGHHLKIFPIQNNEVSLNVYVILCVEMTSKTSHGDTASNALAHIGDLAKNACYNNIKQCPSGSF